MSDPAEPLPDSTALRFAVHLTAHNYLVPWPSPVWWRFWEKVPQRKGFQVVLELAAATAEEARREGERRVRDEMQAKAHNSARDPYKLVVERVDRLEPGAPRSPESGVKKWFSEP